MTAPKQKHLCAPIAEWISNSGNAVLTGANVGKALLPEYFRRVWELLRPGGVFLNSGIASAVANHRNGRAFVDRYVFPDGELVSLNISRAAAETIGFEVRDVESLREHYAMT